MEKKEEILYYAAVLPIKLVVYTHVEDRLYTYLHYLGADDDKIPIYRLSRDKLFKYYDLNPESEFIISELDSIITNSEESKNGEELYVTQEDFEAISNEADEIVSDTISNLHKLQNNLKIFDSKKSKKLKSTIKDFLVENAEEGEIVDHITIETTLYERVNLEKLSKKYLKSMYRAWYDEITRGDVL